MVSVRDNVALYQNFTSKRKQKKLPPIVKKKNQGVLRINCSNYSR